MSPSESRRESDETGPDCQFPEFNINLSLTGDHGETARTEAVGASDTVGDVSSWFEMAGGGTDDELAAIDGTAEQPCGGEISAEVLADLVHRAQIIGGQLRETVETAEAIDEAIEPAEPFLRELFDISAHPNVAASTGGQFVKRGLEVTGLAEPPVSDVFGYLTRKTLNPLTDDLVSRPDHSRAAWFDKLSLGLDTAHIMDCPELADGEPCPVLTDALTQHGIERIDAIFDAVEQDLRRYGSEHPAIDIGPDSHSKWTHLVHMPGPALPDAVGLTRPKTPGEEAAEAARDTAEHAPELRFPDPWRPFLGIELTATEHTWLKARLDQYRQCCRHAEQRGHHCPCSH